MLRRASAHECVMLQWLPQVFLAGPSVIAVQHRWCTYQVSQTPCDPGIVRIAPIRLQPGFHMRQPKLASVFLCYGSFIFTDAVSFHCISLMFFSTKVDDWLGRASRKWPLFMSFGMWNRNSRLITAVGNYVLLPNLVIFMDVEFCFLLSTIMEVRRRCR